MMIGKTKLIPENVAPQGAERITAMDREGNEIGKIPLGRLSPPNGKLSFRFLVISDTHLNTIAYWDRIQSFKEVLAYANQDPDCNFIVVCGDLVDNGQDQTQIANYKSVVMSAMEKPVYSIAGNHDAMWGYPTDDFMENYTGYPFYYAVAKTADKANRIYANEALSDSDLLIFLGYNGKDHSDGNGDWKGGEQFSEDELAWFETIMATNVKKRRIVFIHPYIPNGSGNPPLAADSPKSEPPDIWTKNVGVPTDTGASFLSILDAYPGAFLFHGHSHYRFQTQEEESKAIIHKPNNESYISIHVPSLTKLRDIQNGWRIDLDSSSENYGGEGYVVDVYPDCIYLRGRDFINSRWVGIGTYCV